MERLHPLCEIFPSLGSRDLADLAKNIKENGLKHPIFKTKDGAILDGKNRLAACRAAGVEPRFMTFQGTEGEAERFVISENLTRRQMSTSERAMVAAKLSRLKRGERPNGSGDPSASQDAAAKQLGVSKSSVKRAKAVLDSGDKRLAAKVTTGQVGLEEAARKVREAKRPAPEPEKPKTKTETLMENAVEECNRIIEIMHDLTHIKKELLEFEKTQNGKYLSSQRIEADMDRLIFSLKDSVPYKLCAYCKGDKCKACRGMGWMSKFHFEKSPKEMQVAHERA